LREVRRSAYRVSRMERNTPEGTARRSLIPPRNADTHEPCAGVPLTLAGDPWTEQMQRRTTLA
jgi:hypothetical protein